MKVFQSFRLDTASCCLWRDHERLPLTPKAFDVLCYLVDHRERLVTQDELLEAVWADTHVNPEVVKKAILEIRKNLGDRPDKPAFIETLRKRGYQFIAPVTDSRAPVQREAENGSGKIVGRESALASLDAHFERALAGERRVIFITGEAGIGKTKLVDLFQHRAALRRDCAIIRGQCIEGFGGKEAYYPILEGLGHFASEGQEGYLLQLLAKTAPTWLFQFASLVKPEQRDALHREVLGSTRERMVREICEALEATSLRTPLVIILEDLHWVDPSTVDVISALARRRPSARLLLVGTYRPSEILDSGNPLRNLSQDLLVHRLCDEIAVQPLGPSDIDEYLARVFPGHRFRPGLSELIHRQSGGNALFVSTLVEDMVARTLIVQREGRWTLDRRPEEIRTWIPGSLEQMLRLQFEQLSEHEQRVLTSASVAGERFSVWAVSAILSERADGIESACDHLADRDLFIRSAGIQQAPDGSSSAHYEFRHALFREAAYRRGSSLNRSKLHKSYGERLRDVRGDSGPEVASELALHFEEARDYGEAIRYLVLAAEHAGRRFAHRDAIQVLRHALGLVGRVPEDEQVPLEIGILRRIGDASYALGAMSESAESYEQATAVAARTGQRAAQIESLISLAGPACYNDPTRGLEVCAQAVEVSRIYGDPRLLAQAQVAAASCRLLYDAWNTEDERLYAMALGKIQGSSSTGALASGHMLSVYVRAVQGDYRGALESADLVMQQMTEAVSPAAYLLALGAKAMSLLHLGKFGDVLRIVRAGRETAEKNGVDPWVFVFREAWLRSLCFDFEGVRRLATVNIGSGRDHHAAQPRTIALVAAGHAELHQQNYGMAIERFAQVLDTEATPKFFLHWHWRIRARLGVAEALLRSGDIPNARLETARCLELAQSTADPNLKALASEMSARVAFANRDWTGSRRHIQNALAIVEEFDVPVAAWRIHAAAWELGRNHAATERHQAAARDIILTIANSFDPDEPLRTSLLSAAPVRHLFESARRAGS